MGSSEPTMIAVDPAGMDRRALYRLHISALLPRPIAWVSTLSRAGVANLAPFSFFGGVSSDPPIMGISFAPRRGREKDSLANLRATNELVINMVDAQLLEAAHRTSADVPPEVDEFALAGVTPVPAGRVRAPRVAESPLAMECRVEKILPVGNGPSQFVMCRAILFHVRSDLWDNGAVRPDGYRPVARLGGAAYAHLGDIVELARPDTEALMEALRRREAGGASGEERS
ncbi:MAG: flavin reductase family protein [Candidatus Eisenbacteria bacterium]|nr:flavin reductase family protein [Candidatus Eisenbacteria bacterium]